MELSCGESEQKSPKQDKVYWHDAFYAALQLELHDYQDALIFENEHLLRNCP